jgi:hypothetical protein
MSAKDGAGGAVTGITGGAGAAFFSRENGLLAQRSRFVARERRAIVVAFVIVVLVTGASWAGHAAGRWKWHLLAVAGVE